MFKRTIDPFCLRLISKYIITETLQKGLIVKINFLTLLGQYVNAVGL